MQKVVYISNSRDFTEQNDVNDNQYLVRINKLLEEGRVISQLNPYTVECLLYTSDLAKIAHLPRTRAGLFEQIAARCV